MHSYPGFSDAPRELVYRAFTDPGQLAQWSGRLLGPARQHRDRRAARRAPAVRDDRPGRAQPGRRDVHRRVENELLAGEMEATGVPGVAGPLRVHLRLEFHDEVRLFLVPVVVGGG